MEFAGPGNTVQVQATCRIEGEFALLNKTSWPAQIQLCGENGDDDCLGVAYDPSLPTILPSKFLMAAAGKVC